MDKEVLNPTAHSWFTWDKIDSNLDNHDTSSDLQVYTANTEAIWWLNEIYAELQTLENEVYSWSFLSRSWQIYETRYRLVKKWSHLSWDKKPAADASLFVNNLADPDIQESFITAAASWRKEFATRVWSMQDKAGVPARLQV
jgi:hypothetical protein